ncbi:MAG: GntG family PLP-dependent aldolase [Halobacteriales archaeon]|nr:GntG family PLP-dependent aldolase [Halobacteriales archaeon]
MIDLRSDTVTRPSDAMREAAAAADVGDDVYGEDPEVNALQAEAAELLGTEAALFFPSGTMANQAALRAHTEPGQELLCERRSHLYSAELGGAARLAGLQTRPIDAGPRGVITPEQVAANLQIESDHVAGTGLLALEDTHNMRGGRAIERAALAAAADVAHEAGVPVHLDGARLCNAAVALGVEPAELVGPVDSVMLSLSKGLGAPVGSVLGGSEAFIERAHRARKQYGGGMRQAGVIAAPARLALGNVDRLAADHAKADRLAAGLDELEGLDVQPPETNIFMASTEALGMDADAFLAAIEAEGVRASRIDGGTVRFVTHLDVHDDEIDEAVAAVGRALA